MRSIINTLIVTIVLGGTINAQNINFTELNPGPAFFDARNGSIDKGDIDGDGDIDVFIAGKDGNQLKSTLYTNDGNGNFTVVVGTSFVDLQFGSSKFADVDQDGDLDLFITGSNLQSANFANLYLNDGGGVFSLVSNTPFQESSEGDVAFNDIDGDGDLDLMMVGYDPQGDGFTKLYQNNETGVYTELNTSVFEPAKSGSIAFFDYDNDNDNDVVVAGENNNGSILTTLYSNNGSGVFSVVPNTSFPGIMSGDIGIADTDNDGDLDVLINGSSPPNGNLTNIFLNDGTGGFSILSNTNFPQTSLSDAEFADFDNDGDMDILVTGSIVGANFASDIFENTGSNNFITAVTLNPMYITSTTIADFDGDNDLDVIMVGINNTPTAFKTRTFINNSTILSVSENKINSAIHIYPNPSNNLININLDKGQLNAIEIYNLTGTLIFKTDLNSNNFKLNIEKYPSGTYILRIFDQNYDVTTSKIVKE